MTTGTIARKTDKGFGFIKVPGEDKDVFFHSDACAGMWDSPELAEGKMVSFDTEQSDRGPRAVNVVPVKAGAAAAPAAAGATAAPVAANDNDAAEPMQEAA